MITGILLAAGESRRFGSQKLLHPLADGTPMALASAMNLARGVDDVVAVVAPEADDVIHVFSEAGVAVHLCERSYEGMGNSLACGIHAAPKSDGWLIALADMPFILPSTIAAVAHALRDGAAIAAPAFDGRRGHPVGFSREYHAQLAQLTGDVGAKQIVNRDQARVVLVPVNDPGIHRDIDVPQDLGA